VNTLSNLVSLIFVRSLSVRVIALTIVSSLWLVGPATAHFIFIVPVPDNLQQAKVVFSEDLEPDDAVNVELISKTQVRSGGKALTMTKGEHAYLVELPPDADVVAGECRYGVLQRGPNKPFLLMYYAKLIRGDRLQAPAANLPLEIVPKGGNKFAVLSQGLPAAGAEVHCVAPKKKGPITADKNGEFEWDVSQPELYGFRARYIESASGEVDGKKYDEVRHYTTLVFRVKAAKEEPAVALPPLPRAVASFGADATGGWLYIYGGHCAKTHSYSTEAVVGTFHRLNLANPTGWEELPGGPGLQGLALVAHDGKLYRLGGMVPRNKPGEQADNHSVSSCARFDPQTRTWEPLPDLPQPRSSHDAVVIGDRVYVIGGWWMKGRGQESQWHETALVLDLRAKRPTWQEIPQPFRRRALAVARFGEKIYVLGGLTEDNETVRTVNVFDTKDGTWSDGPPLPGFDRNGFAPAAYLGKDRPHAALADGRIIRLTDQGDRWEEIGRLKQPRIAGRMVGVGNRLLILGGAIRGDNLALVESIPLP
jgi:hypothetical protein